MNRLPLCLCMGLVMVSCSEASQKPAANAQPRVVIHHYPQRVDRGVLKWDCPVFAAYRDGSVIWRKNWATSVDAFAITEGPTTTEIAAKFETLMARYGGKTFTLTDSSDPEVTTVWSAGKMLTILGDWRKPRLLKTSDSENADSYRQGNEHERKLWSTLPAEVRALLTAVISFEDKDGKAWRPEKLSLLLQPPNRIRVEPVAWPMQWPQSFAVVPGSQAMKSIELPGGMLDELLQLLPTDGEPKAVLLNGEARYAEIRFVFPGQSAWTNEPTGQP